MATIDYLAMPRSTFLAIVLMRLLAFITRWRAARRVAHSARIERIISKGLSTFD
jgi:hypothetical protein